MTIIESTNTSPYGSSTDNATRTFLCGESEEHLDFFKFARIIVPVVFGLITVTGIAGNSITAVVILSNKGIKSTTDILILNLAVADIIFIVCCIPIAVDVAMLDDSGNTQWPFIDELCRISGYIISACSYISVYILVLISLDRYLALVHPIRAFSIRNKRNCYIVLTVFWSIILLGNTPMLFENLFCPGLKNRKKSSMRVLHICLFVFGFVLPIIMMCVLYGHILKLFLTRNIPGMNNQRSLVHLQSKQRVTKMVITVVMVFIICKLPFHIYSLYVNFENRYENYPVILILRVVLMLMTYANSCINPILYSFYSKTFRKRCRDLFSCNK